MKILVIGDIYGKPGRETIRKLLPGLRGQHHPDWVIANGENATGGTGLSAKHRDRLFECGIDIITTGNHLFARNDWPQMIAENERVLRPHNIGGDRYPGKGVLIIRNGEKAPLAVMNLTGRIFMESAECPFRWASKLLERVAPEIPVILDFHSEATSEKIAMGWHLDGQVSLVAGTHTHVQTSDEKILPKGTGYISDLGMTGPREGILGVEKEIVLERFLKGFSDRFLCAKGPTVLEGIVAEISGRQTLKIERFRLSSP